MLLKLLASGLALTCQAWTATQRKIRADQLDMAIDYAVQETPNMNRQAERFNFALKAIRDTFNWGYLGYYRQQRINGFLDDMVAAKAEMETIKRGIQRYIINCLNPVAFDKLSAELAANRKLAIERPIEKFITENEVWLKSTILDQTMVGYNQTDFNDFVTVAKAFDKLDGLLEGKQVTLDAVRAQYKMIKYYQDLEAPKDRKAKDAKDPKAKNAPAAKDPKAKNAPAAKDPKAKNAPAAKDPKAKDAPKG